MTMPRNSRPVSGDPSDSAPVLDSARTTERPSSATPVGTDIGTSPAVPVHVLKVRRAEPISVSVRYVPVEGENGEALARRQAAAIRYALTCLSRSDEPESPERSGRRSSSNSSGRERSANEDNNGADQP
ncbi:hypothetical protein [Streptomyces sp. BH055]|uniref:hypothetical protein n=1 Tax=Streptomyces sp. BH055 TaxID=3401173 RepID=UPI003BB6F58B